MKAKRSATKSARAKSTRAAAPDVSASAAKSGVGQTRESTRSSERPVTIVLRSITYSRVGKEVKP